MDQMNHIHDVKYIEMRAPSKCTHSTCVSAVVVTERCNVEINLFFPDPLEADRYYIEAVGEMWARATKEISRSDVTMTYHSVTEAVYDGTRQNFEFKDRNGNRELIATHWS
jgi:hypothetical protein